MTFNEIKSGLAKAFVYSLVSVFALVGTMPMQSISKVQAATSTPTNTRYVGNQVIGNNDDLANDCSDELTPCSTINNAIDKSMPGDTIKVAVGTYPEAVIVDKQLTINGSNAGISAGSQPGTRSAESTVVGSFALLTVGEGSIVDGFTVKNGTSFGTNDNDAFYANSTNVGFTIKNNIIRDVVGAQSSGIEATTNANNLIIKNNEITNNNRGIYLNTAHGIQIIGNNIHHNNIATPGVGIGSDSQSYLTITGNTISNQSEGFGISNAGANVAINNNSFTNITTDPIGWYTPGQTINAQNNWWGSQADPSPSIIGSANVTSTPWYMDPARTSLSNQGPGVSITQPSAGDHINGTSVNVSGTVNDADPKNAVFTVTDSNSFSKTYPFVGGETNPSFLLNTTEFADGDANIQLHATDSMGNPSNTFSIVVTIDNTTPVTPTNFVATAGDGQVNLTWDAVLTADSYRISHYDVTANPTTAPYAYNTVAGNVTNFNIGQLINGHNYAFGIQAIDAPGNASSFAVTNATPVSALASIANFTATSGNGQVRLNWDTFPGVDHYKVCNITVGLCYDTQTFHSQQFTFINLNNGQAYDFNIQAMNANNESISTMTTASGTTTTPVITVASSTSTSFRDLSNSTSKTKDKADKDAKAEKDNKASDKNGKIKGEETKNDTASDKAVLTFVILLLALAAGIGGYYAYEWWLTKQDEKPVTPIEDKQGKITDKPNNNNNNNKSNSKKKKNGRW